MRIEQSASCYEEKSMRLKGRVAIVTGAAGGLGKMFAMELAGEGAHVAVVDVHDAAPVQKEIEAGGGKALALSGNVTDPVVFNSRRLSVRSFIVMLLLASSLMLVPAAIPSSSDS